MKCFAILMAAGLITTTFSGLSAAAHAQDATKTDSVKTYKANQTVLAPATGLTEAVLGDSFNEAFKKTDKFVSAAPSEATANLYNLTVTNLDDETLLAAHQALLAKLGVKPSPKKRYCVVRVYRAVSTKEVSLFAMGDKKPSGKVVAAKMFYGHMIEAVLEGDSAKFNDKSGVRSARRGTDLLKEAAKRGLTVRAAFYGVTPKSGSLPIPEDAEDFARRYNPTQPAPLFVEYSVANDFAPKPIAFADARIQPGQWIVTAVKVELDARKPNNSNWDPLGGKPDLIISLELNKSVYATSKKFNNTYDAIWNANTSMKLLPKQVVQVSVVDKDPTGDDYAGSIAIETDKIFNYEPGQEIYLTVKDEKSGIKSATITLEPAKKR